MAGRDEVGDLLAVARREDEQVGVQPVGDPGALGPELVTGTDELFQIVGDGHGHQAMEGRLAEHHARDRERIGRIRLPPLA